MIKQVYCLCLRITCQSIKMSELSTDYPQCLFHSDNGCHNKAINNAFKVIWIVKVKLGNQNKNTTGANPEGWATTARTPKPNFFSSKIKYFGYYLIFVFWVLLAFAYDIFSLGT